MKKIYLNTAAICIFALPAFAQAPAFDRQGAYLQMQEQFADLPGQIVEMSDIDGNGKLSRNEISEVSKGYLTREEFIADYTKPVSLDDLDISSEDDKIIE